MADDDYSRPPFPPLLPSRFVAPYWVAEWGRNCLRVRFLPLVLRFFYLAAGSATLRVWAPIAPSQLRPDFYSGGKARPSQTEQMLLAPGWVGTGNAARSAQGPLDGMPAPCVTGEHGKTKKRK